MGRVVMMGIRWSESRNRKENRKMTESCPSMAKTTLNPIIDWEERDVWTFLATQGIEYCPLYDEGFKRLGCVMCPMGYYKTRIKEAERWPGFFRAFMRCFEKMLEKRDADGKETKWHNAEEVMRWWLEERKWNEEYRERFGRLMRIYTSAKSAP